jgi:hypothetical protein
MKDHSQMSLPMWQLIANHQQNITAWLADQNHQRSLLSVEFLSGYSLQKY